MKYSILAGLTAAVMALSSCSTITHTAQSAGVDPALYNLTVADMDVSKQRVQHTVEWKWTPFKSVSLSNEKTNATAELLQQSNADVLVEPQYLVKKRGIFRGGSVTVSGYPATYKNFHPMTEAEANIIATAEGRCKAYPQTVLRTTSTKPATGFVRRREKVAPTRFLSLVAGPVNAGDMDYDLEGGVRVGLMYGKYGSRWGWYIKGDFMTAHSVEDVDDNRGYSGIFTAGAIKTIGRHSNIMLGAGLGAGLRASSRDYVENFFTVPLELTYKYSFSNFNVMAGCAYLPRIKHGFGEGNYLPFVGIGINL